MSPDQSEDTSTKKPKVDQNRGGDENPQIRNFPLNKEEPEPEPVLPLGTPQHIITKLF